MSDLDSILSGRESAPATQETIKEPPEAVATEPVEQEAIAPTEEGSEGQHVPVAALQAERQKAKTYKEQVADFERKLSEQNAAWEQRLNQLFSTISQPKQPVETPKAPDFWEAPETAIDYRLTQSVAPLQSQLAQMREDFSRMQAIDKHGQETVDAAFTELSKLRASNDPAFATEYQRIMSSPHPYGSLVEWHKRQQVMSEIGSDPAAYKEKLKAELLAEMQASAPQAQQPVQNAMPSNFATTRNVGTRSGPTWSGPAPIQDIFKR